ncbi:hypothetical protein EMEDMD4_1320002 [Sinorhizobium medicae]|uniref:Uncharacterized protein n=1 Tax=Sinorhizobium medicae TaxID=110321 RepID=A0A508WWS7_9HYPH|nr:hypothetical protein EMEDMD4_1320002 [Sinorhizobium medicae]
MNQNRSDLQSPDDSISRGNALNQASGIVQLEATALFDIENVVVARSLHVHEASRLRGISKKNERTRRRQLCCQSQFARGLAG